jgi:hypothetical protein
MHNIAPKCVWASSISVEKKMNWAKDNQRKKEAGNIFVLPAHIMFGNINNSQIPSPLFV